MAGEVRRAARVERVGVVSLEGFEGGVSGVDEALDACEIVRRVERVAERLRAVSCEAFGVEVRRKRKRGTMIRGLHGGRGRG